MEWNGASFTVPAPLVSAEGMQNNFYPGIAPDDTWVVFNRGAGESYHTLDATLWAVRADRASAPMRLAHADGTGMLGNSWPKWAPFIQSYQGEPLLWITFSSRRDYGLRLRQQNREPAQRNSQLWMAAFRPSRAGTGDPSAPAFWIPFQDPGVGNHIAQWSEQVQRQACRTDTDCRPGERCLPNQAAAAASFGCVMQ
jgi:TolB protein